MWKELTRFPQLIPFKKSTILNSNHLSAQSDSAKALSDLEKEKEAFASIKKELSLNPQDKKLHRILIEKLGEKNRLGDLESVYKEVTEMIADPESVSNFYLTNAEALFNKKMIPQFFLAFREAMKDDLPMGYELCCKYGEAFQYEGRYEEALVLFEQVKKGAPTEHEGRARNGAAYLNYCLGRVQQAKEEFEDLIRDGCRIALAKWNYVLMLYHLGEDEKVINHYKEREFMGWFPLSEGDAWVKFYAQELRLTRLILERDGIDENTRKFNTKKLEALNVLFTSLQERINKEVGHQQCW